MRIAFCILSMVFWAAASAQTPQLAVNPSSQTIEIDSSAMLTIRIQTMPRVHAYSILLSYNPLTLKCVSVDRGNFFQAGTSLFFFSIDTVNGRVGIDEALVGSGGRNGSGDLMKIRFVGIQNSTNAIQFISASLRDTLNQVIASFATDGAIQVGEPNSVLTPKKAGQLLSLSCYPNPFNSSTVISYENPLGGRMQIAVYNLAGQLVKRLRPEDQESGNHRVIWDGSDEKGMLSSSGVYLVRLIDEQKRSLTGKIQFIK